MTNECKNITSNILVNGLNSAQETINIVAPCFKQEIVQNGCEHMLEVTIPCVSAEGWVLTVINTEGEESVFDLSSIWTIWDSITNIEWDITNIETDITNINTTLVDLQEQLDDIECCSAEDTSFDNTDNGLSATNIQDAIDEILALWGWDLALDDLIDVDAPNPDDCDILIFNSTTGNWETCQYSNTNYPQAFMF